MTSTDEVMSALSIERFHRYLLESHMDEDQACELYLWNAHVAAALFELIGHVEVIVRNAMSSALDDWSHSGGYGEWYLNRHGLFEAGTQRRIAEAVQRIEQRGQPITHERVTAELSLGFWRFLLSRRYKTTLWPWVLKPVFIDASDSYAVVLGPLARVHDLRNRIAHHEHIFGRRLDLDVRDLLFLVSAVAPAVVDWVENAVDVWSVLAEDPRRGAAS